MKITDIVDSIIEKTNTNTTDIATIETNKIDTTLIHNATSKTTPVDADELALLDSVSSFDLKKLTFANLKATLKTYFDTIYDLSTVWVVNDSRAKTALNASGSAPIYAGRAWVSFNGTGTVTINGGGNFSSITDYGAGFFGANMAISMPDSNYSVVCSTGTAAGGGNKQPDITVNLKSASQVQVVTTGISSNSYTDNVYNEIVILR